jgi:hypothetical protein
MKFRFAMIALMMDAARTFETSVENYFTRQYIPEDKSELHTRRRENLKSHLKFFLQIFLLKHSIRRPKKRTEIGSYRGTSACS